MSKLIKLSLLLCAFVVGMFYVAPKKYLNSIPPLNVSDTLSSSQLSYFARLSVGNTAGDTFVKIATSGNPSKNTTNLSENDVVGIGRSGLIGFDLYTVKDIGSTAMFQVDRGLAASNVGVSAMVVATRSAIHTVRFTPQSNVAGGAWEFLLKATNRTGETPNDGIPDQQGFDLGADVGTTTTGIGTALKAADVSCPWGATASVGTTAVVGGNNYHVITCQLGAGITNPIGVEGTVVIGRSLASGSQLINPAPSLSHVGGIADSNGPDIYTFYVRHRDASAALIDSDTLQGRIAVVDAVRVTATVDPTLTFTISNTGVAQGATVCGQTLGSAANNTTSTSVAFGSLALGAFNDLAQRISCVTNSKGGYAVTVYETSPMANVSTGTGTTIADTNCDGTCGVGTTGPWGTDVTHSEWGYSIENINANQVAFTYGVGTSFYAKAFGVGATNAQMVMQNAALPSATENAYMCYRLTASTTQEAGKYETELVYTATAKF